MSAFHLDPPSSSLVDCVRLGSPRCLILLFGVAPILLCLGRRTAASGHLSLFEEVDFISPSHHVYRYIRYARTRKFPYIGRTIVVVFVVVFVMPRFKVLILGDTKVGKSLLRQKMAPKDEKIIPKGSVKVGRSTFEAQLGPSKETCTFDLQDTGGMERYATMPRDFFQHANGIILVYDVTNKDSLQNTEFWKKEGLRNGKTEIVYMLIGNKSDVAVTDRETIEDDGQEMADEMGCLFMEVSATTGKNVNEAMLKLAREIYDVAGNARDSKRISAAPEKAVKKSGGCAIL